MEIKPSRSVYKLSKKDPKEYRRYQKIISKEARVIKAMRKMKGLSIGKVAQLSNLHPSSLEHRENGRTNLKKEEISNIVRALNFSMEDYHEMMASPFLRIEILEQCHRILERIDTEKLNAVRAFLINFN